MFNRLIELTLVGIVIATVFNVVTLLNELALITN